MTCIKTGCQIFIHEYNCWATGDAYQFGDLLIFRLNHRTFDGPPRPRTHFEVLHMLEWFDRDRTDASCYSHLIARAGSCNIHLPDGTDAGR